jgi:hypothetical protein
MEEDANVQLLAFSQGLVSGAHDIQANIYEFYIALMCSEEPKFLSLGPSCWPRSSCANPLEKDQLAITFTMEELEKIVQDTKTATAPCSDGFPVAFFKNCWLLIKDTLLQILNGFVLGSVDIARLNFGVLSLIPKFPGAETIKQYQLIALINVVFKFIAKAFATRLYPVAHRIISPAQTSFIKEILILDGALSLHEIIHELKSKKLPVILIKLDFEKSYDRVSWQFLREVLIKKGFESVYIHRIMQLVRWLSRSMGKLVLTSEIRGECVGVAPFPLFC